MDVPELIAADDYNASANWRIGLQYRYKAKLSASLKWLLHMAYSCDIPSELQDAVFAVDSFISRENVIPPEPVVLALCSGTLYVKACCNIFGGSIHNYTGHSSVLEALSRHSIYVLDVHESAVSDKSLSQTSPFVLTAHLALIDSLMMAQINRLAPVETVVQTVRRLTKFNASSELPSNSEDALIFWVNKVCAAQHEQICNQQRAFARDPKIRGITADVYLPQIQDVTCDFSDGCCLAALISFYCPTALRCNDIILQPDLGIADSLYNLQLIQEWCYSLPPHCQMLHFTIHDFFYALHELHPNLVVFLVELFHALAVQPLPCVQSPTPSQSARTMGEVRPSGTQSPQKEALRLVGRSPYAVELPPMSSALKRSLQKSVADNVRDSMEPRPISQGLSKQGPLLPRRWQKNQQGELAPPQQSIPAWPEHQPTKSITNPHGRRNTAATSTEDPSRTMTSNMTSVTTLGESTSSSMLDNVDLEASLSMSETNLDVGWSHDPINAGPPSGRIADVQSREGNPYPASQNNPGSGSSTPSDSEYLTPQAEVPPLDTGRSYTVDRPTFRNLQDIATEQAHSEPPPQRPDSLLISKTVRPARPGSKHTSTHNSAQSPKTSFAQLQQHNKENSHYNPLAGVQGLAVSLKDQFELGKVAGSKSSKKTTFSALPNQTTWQEIVQKSNSPEKQVIVCHDETSPQIDYQHELPPTVGVSDMRMQFAERRKAIENNKRKLEMQLNKQRQRVGKAAFMQVISKDKNDDKVDGEPVSGLQQDSLTHMSAFTPVGNLQDQGAYDKPKDFVRVAPPSQSEDRLRVVMHKFKTNNYSLDEQLPPQAPNKEFSRENIQNKIDSVKQRWFSKEEPVIPRRSGHNQQLNRPKTYHEGQDQVSSSPPPYALSRSQEDANKPVAARSGIIDSGRAERATYSNSLDKLNISLSELQGEIMRLSLEQDHIKTMVKDEHRKSPVVVLTPGSIAVCEVTTDSVAMPVPTVVTAVPPFREQAGMPGNAVRQVHQLPPQMLQQQYATHGPEHYPYAQQPMPAYTGYPGNYHGYGPNAHTTPPYLYNMHPPMGYPGHWGVMPHPSHQPVTYPGIGAPVSANNFGNPVPHCTYNTTTFHSTGMSSVAPTSFANTSVSSPVQNISHQGQAFTNVNSEQPRYVMDSQYEMSLREASNASHNTDNFQPTAESVVQSQHESLIYERSPTHVDLEDPTQYDSQRGNVNGGFFLDIGFNDPPIKPKPRLGNKKTLANTKDVGEDTVLNGKWEDPEKHVPVFPTNPPAEVFHIEIDENPADTEVERKKQKMMEALVEKRTLDVVKMKQKIEKDRERLAHQQRIKEERTEQKKMDEKSRREQIFQEYLRRKAEQDAEEQGSSTPPVNPAVARRNKVTVPRSAGPPKGTPSAKPKGHAPIPQLLDRTDKCSGGSSSTHSSQEELRNLSTNLAFAGTPTQQERANLFARPSSLPMQPLDDEGPRSTVLQYGGITHRRPPTPGQRARTPGHTNQPPTPELTGRAFGDQVNNNADYKGPKLFKKPSQKSNRQVVSNAISHCCLAGTVNTDLKNRVLEIINESEVKHFVILFRDAGLQFRGVYSYNPDTGEVLKLQGKGPKQISDNMIEKFYKYNSGAKQFSQVDTTKHMSATIDGVILFNQYWQKKKAPDSRTPGADY